jgi:hypothetical protein
VNLNSPVSTTIAALTSLATPGSIPDNNRIQPTETTVWVINATLRAYQKQSDQDYHLQLIDGAGHQMIAEIVSPSCVNPSSPFAAGVSRARAQFDAKYKPNTSVKNVNIPVQITGVGFFDHLEGQQGVAPNGIELHPIIDIIFSPTSDFAMTSSPTSLSLAQGNSGNATITTTLSGTFNSSIALSASGVPAGATATFTPTAISAPGSGSATMTIAVGSTTATGTYNVVVTGTGGGKTHSTTITLTVTAAGGSAQQLLGNPGFENGSVATPWVASAGVIDSSTLQPARSGIWKAWMNGYGSTHTDTLSQQVTIPANATRATLSFWLYVYTVETTSTTAYDTLAVQIRSSSGTVLTTLANYSNLSPKAPYAQATFDVTSFKGQTIQVYLLGTEDGSLQTSFIIDDFSLGIDASGDTSDFAIASSPTSLAVTQGDSGNSTISTTLSGSFNSSVALSASGLPAGATSTFNPTAISAPGSGSATLTIAASSATATGTYNVVVTGTGGGKTHTTTISLTVTPAASDPGDFAITASPTSLSLTQGNSGNSTITTTLSGSFNSGVALSASGLPAGATPTFAPTTISAPGSGSATLTIAASSTTATGTYNVVVTGTGGGKTHTTTIALTVTAASGGSTQLLGNPGFENGAVATPWVASAGVVDSSTTQPPRTGMWKAWLNGYGSTHTDTLSQQVTIPANATRATLSFWLYVYTAETTTSTAYDKLAVQIRNSSGTVLATLANYSNLSPKAPYAQATFDITSFKGQTIQIYLLGTEDQGLQTSFIIDDFALDVTQ